MKDLRMPEHIAIIMDGNGRWAKQRLLPRKLGHKAGCEALETLLEDCARLGLRYLTVYAFSTENWKRSADEVSALMQLFRSYLDKIRKKAMENNIRVKAIGERSRFDEDIQVGLARLEADTAGNTGMTFVIAINYGGRDELLRAMRRMAGDAAAGAVLPEQITQELLESYLDTAGMPDPDLVIRTSGEQRLSNFLLWQAAYAELYFSEVYWPDFTKEELLKAVDAYNKRERRYGGRKEA